MIFLPKRRPFLPEVIALLLLAVALALAVNLIRPHGLTLFQNWTQTSSTGEDAALDMETALALHADGDVLFLDARSFSEYSSAHIPGAANLPVETAGNGDGPLVVVTYCGNEICAKAKELTEILEKRGLRFVFLPDGISGWLSSGGPLEGK